MAKKVVKIIKLQILQEKQTQLLQLVRPWVLQA